MQIRLPFILLLVLIFLIAPCIIYIGMERRSIAMQEEQFVNEFGRCLFNEELSTNDKVIYIRDLCSANDMLKKITIFCTKKNKCLCFYFKSRVYGIFPGGGIIKVPNRYLLEILPDISKQINMYPIHSPEDDISKIINFWFDVN